MIRMDACMKIPGKVTDALSDCAKENKIVLVGGSIYKADRGHTYNTSVVFDENGENQRNLS